MIVRVLLLLLTILPIGSHLQADFRNDFKSFFTGKGNSQDPSIRVLLLHDVDKVHLEVQGKYSLYDPNKNSYLSTRYMGKARYMETMSDGLKWGEAFPGIYQIQIKPLDKSTITYVDNNEYPGSLFIYDIGGTISIVNDVGIETYIDSILGGFDVSALEPETVAALAIAARTNAYYQAANPKTNYWAVDAQKIGYTGNPNQSENLSKTGRAVQVTKDMILSRTGVYEKVATPFPVDFGFISPQSSLKNFEISKITLQEANNMAKSGMHAAQILTKAFPGTTIMLNR